MQTNNNTTTVQANDSTDSIRGRLKEVRKSLGKTQAQFAQDIGIIHSTIAKYESGVIKPGFDMLSKICKTYKNINMNWLLTGEGELYTKDHKGFASLLHDMQGEAQRTKLREEATPKFESKDFFEEMRYDITIEYNRLRLQERKLIVAQYLHEHLGAHQIDAWRACEYLDFAGQKQRLLRRLRQQGLTQNEERTLVALMDKI